MTATKATTTSYHRPYRPLAIRAFNSAARAAASFGIDVELSSGELIAAARKRNGLHDFGAEALLEPLEVLLDSIRREASLNPLGRLITRQRLIGVLGNRLRAQELLQRRPEIRAREVAPLLVITGLQRTGTTLLHRLLTCDPAARTLASWEALNPAPFLPYEPRVDDKRIAVARMSETALAYMAPDFFAVHPVEAEAPEEESLLLDYTLLSPVSEATLRVPSYATWLRAQDVTPAYRYLASLLKLLQWQRPAQRWVLKTPHHLGALDVLFSVFPEAKVVQTHRDPCSTVASFCSMIAHGRGVFSDRVDPHEIGDEWLAKQRQMVEHAMAVRDRGAEQKVLDVKYENLIHDPIGEVETIYDHFGIPLSPVARRAMRASLRVNVQHRHGRHLYQLADFGLDRSRVRSEFAAYCKRYDIGEQLNEPA